MENRKFIKFLIPILILGFFVSANQALAYGVETHAFLTKEAINFYNKNFSHDIAEEFKNYLIDGARQEDNMPRYVNHFYDPVNDRGLDDLGFQGFKSKDWAQDEKLQNRLTYKIFPSTVASILSASQIETIQPVFNKTNYTWQKAIDLYAQGNTEQALFTLGHVVHLVQDAAVPDHTRNDGHPPYDDGGSPYENWTHDFTLANPDSGLAGRLSGKKPVVLSSLADYFDVMAKYSNNNFYSRDSIKNYELPKVINVWEDINLPTGYVYGISNDGNSDFRLVLGKKGSKFSWRDNNFVELTDLQLDDVVVANYWHRLSVKAVQHAAGVINLFFKEAEAARQKYLTEKAQRPYLGTLIDALRAIFGGGKVQDPSDLINELKKPVQKPVAEIVLDEDPILDEAREIEEVVNQTELPVPAAQEEEDILSAAAPAVVAPPVSAQTLPAVNQTASLNQIISAGQSDNAPKCKFNPNLNPNYKDLVINEVAWMGNLASANDEWIELKNISGQELDISGWLVLDKDGQIAINIPIGKKLPVGEFYLLERTDDNSVPGVSADQVYTGALSNSDEGLQVFDSKCNLVDEVLADPSWPAGDNAEKKTMERKADLSWQTGIVLGTPKAENSLLAEPEPEPELPPVNPPPPVPQTSADHAVISEILFDVEGSDSGKEFIELYNPTDQAVDISGWSIQHLSSSGSLTKKNFEEGDAVAPKGFFLIWLGSSTSSPQADMVWASGSLNNTSATISLVNGETPVDSVQYDINQLPGFSAGKSLERKAYQNSCISAQGSGEYLGNGCDNNVFSDWETRTVPKPQNTQNLPEPRQVAAVEELEIDYDSSNLEFSFEWEMLGGLTYRLSDVSPGTTTIIAEITPDSEVESASWIAKEIGKEYKFEITAIDAEGLASDPAQFNYSIPSFFDVFAFYQDPRFSTSSPQYLLDLNWSNYPFVPNSEKWQVALFYYNQETPVTDDLFWLDYSGSAPYKSWGLIAPNGFKVIYPNCLNGFTKGSALIIPVGSDNCDYLAGNHASLALNWNQLEDNHLLISVVEENFASSSPIAGQDFVTIAFYSYQPGYEPNNYGIRQVAIDKTKYFFQDSVLGHQPPDRPEIIDAEFDQDSSVLTFSWDAVSDSDSLDNLIIYEISYGSITATTSATSLGVNVYLGESYNFSIKAKDELGNYSESSEYAYDVPDSPLPYALTNVQWGHLDNSSSTTLRIEFSDYPFMDFNDPGAILFFVNQAPPAGYSFLDDDYRNGEEIGGPNSVLTLSYYPCDYKGSWTSLRAAAGLILKNKDCPNKSNGLAISELLAAKIDKQDNAFTAGVVGDFTAGDYITIGFYRLGEQNQQTGEAYFENSANYNKKIYFQE